MWKEYVKYKGAGIIQIVYKYLTFHLISLLFLMIIKIYSIL